VYLGVIVVLATALAHGLTEKRRQYLMDILDIAPKTLSRWRQFWRETFPQSRCWQTQRGCIIPPVEVMHLPDALLERLTADTLVERLRQLLVLICPVTTTSSSTLRVSINPQKMGS